MKTSMTAARTFSHRLATTVWPSLRTLTVRKKYRSTSSGRSIPDLPVALLNTRLYAKPEDDIDDGQYVSLFQLYLDGFMLSRTGRKRNKDAEA